MLQLYSIYDIKAQTFNKPFFCLHVSEATRSIQASFDLPKAEQPWFVKHPEDFKLFLIGTFDPKTGGFALPSTLGPEFTFDVAALAPRKEAPRG